MRYSHAVSPTSLAQEWAPELQAGMLIHMHCVSLACCTLVTGMCWREISQPQYLEAAEAADVLNSIQCSSVVRRVF